MDYTRIKLESLYRSTVSTDLVSFQSSLVQSTNSMASRRHLYLNKAPYFLTYFNLKPKMKIIRSGFHPYVLFQEPKKSFIKSFIAVLSIYFQYTFNIHSIYIQYIFNILSIYFQYILNIHSIYFRYTFNIHSFYRQSRKVWF